MKYDSLGIRMKGYEYVSRYYLTKKIPVIIRIDGKAFHTFTKGFQKPFDEILSSSMQETMKYLCSHIQGCVLGYTQSDEISLVLIDYKNIDSDSWFGYNVQKMASIAASIATLEFNRVFNKLSDEYLDSVAALQDFDTEDKYLKALRRAKASGALFDARAFNVPKEDVCNNILWRQNDATRNSIEMVAHTYFSQNQLHKKNCGQIQEMLFKEKEINWNNYPTKFKRGSCCIKETYYIDRETKQEMLFTPKMLTSEGLLKYARRSRWIIDNEIPIFKSEGREYIENLIEG